jgi:hypothetical protein
MISKAVIRPSNLHRRERCPGSLYLESTINTPEEDTEYAGRGRRIHSDVADGILHPEKRMDLMALSDCGEDADILAACWAEADLLWNGLTDAQRGRAKVLVERYVKLDCVDMEGGGTPDFAIVVMGTDTEDGFVILRDWKTGAGWVPGARWNLQLAAYARGIMVEFGLDGFADIGVFQPAIHASANQWVASKGDLAIVGERIKAIVAHCVDSIQDLPLPDAPVIPGGHCQYCRAKERCERRIAVVSEVKQLADPLIAIKTLTGQARTEFYNRLKTAKTLLETVIDEVNGAIIKGVFEIPGYVVGDGNKKRTWNMPDSDAIARLSLIATKKGISSDLVAEPLSVAKAEKLLGKTAFDEGMILVTPGNPTVKKAK